MRRLILWFAAFVVGFALLLPVIAYFVGLVLVPTFPDPPANGTVVESSVQEQWQLHSGALLGYGATDRSMSLAKVDPWSYAYHALVRCKDRRGGSDAIHRCIYYFPGYRAALTVAASHLFGSPLNIPASFLDELKVASLSIWLTRNWAPHQIAAYLASHK